ncbi:group 1 truncated hemoglobin [Mangrovimicrobium sediminis]|uniref:Group 1 truncated hemoglobin n=1 Tax=Mangrovimicrobium sediminis TaxID=2562682 RepID=A0A4Z0M7K6_9GAMM|nr:group 1 truncated hemoglobin [Haliea sp. SAOS-164]TGD75474.1 group 1 truncated hemoglobin [Haliea sp. SAOS-164]
MRLRLLAGLFSLLVVLGLPACAGTAAGKDTLYRDLGGEQGIDRLVETFIRKVGRDERILPYFARASVSHFREGFTTHLCQVSGGPCTYDGDSMPDIHTGMQIDEADFNRVVELLVEAMEDNGIAYPVQNRLLARLAPLRGEIIHI